MKRILTLGVWGWCLFGLLGCGGGGGSEKSEPRVASSIGVSSAVPSLPSSASSSNMNLVTINGKVYVQGALSNATVTLVKLGASADEVVYTGEIGSNGEFVHNLEHVDLQAWYQYKATSGTDTVSGLSNQGTITSLIKGSVLLEHKSSIQINPITDLLARLSVNGAAEQVGIADRQDAVVQYLIEDINQDGQVNTEDLMVFDYKNHQDRLIIANEDLRTLYIPALIEQADDANSTNLDKMIVAVLRPEVVVQGGQIIEPSSSLIPHLSKPIPGQVRWLLDNVEADSITIQDAGNYRLTAEVINKSGQVISHITTPLYAASREMLSSLDLSATATEVQQLNIYQDTERDHDLVGASVAVPPGAVAENVAVSMAALDIPSIPLIEGSPIGGVLSMQPSGQVFNQPVEIGLPYDSALVKPEEIMVARHSGGIVDYLTPTYVDTENHMVYFHTSHFTEFQLTGWVLKTNAAKTHLPEIKDIAKKFKVEYSDNEWEAILNYKPSEQSPSPYDLYLTMVLDKEIAEAIKSGLRPYSAAYQKYYGSPDGEWKSSLNVFNTMLDTQAKIEGITDGFSATYHTTVLLSKGKYWTAVKNIGLGKIKNLVPSHFVNWYFGELFNKGEKAIAEYNDIQYNEQLEMYFLLRNEGHSANAIINALNSTITKSEETDLAGLSPYLGIKGWLYTTGGNVPVAKVDTRDYWKMAELLYLRATAYTEASEQHLVDAITYAKQELDSAANPYIIINNNQSPLLSNGICSGSTTHLDISLASYGEKLSSPAAILKDKDSREVQSVIASDKCSQKLGQWSCSYQQKMPSVQTEKTFNYELKVMDGDLSGTLNYSVMVRPLIKHDVEQLHLGSVEYIPGYYLLYSGISLKGNQFYNAKYQLNAIASDGKAMLVDVDNGVIKIPEAEFGALALDKVAITVSAATNASCQTINQKKFEIDINGVIRQYAEANKPVVQLMSVDGATVNNVSSMLEAPQNSVVIFSVRVANGATITTYAMGGTTTQSKSAPKDTTIIGGTIYQIPYRFNNAGEFLPWVLVKMPNGDLHRANAPRIRVIEANKQIDQNAPVVIPENLPPQANAGSDQQLPLKQTVLLTGAQSKDVDGYITSYRWYRAGKFVGSGAQLSIGNLPIGSHVFTLEVIDNAGATSTDVVNITIIGPRLEAPSSISFDSVPIGQSKTLPLTIRNSGNAELTGISLSLNSAEFQISSMPSRLAAGAQAVVQVTFTPEAEVPSSAAITIKSNELADASVSLSGSGIANKLLVRVIPSATTLRVNDELKLRIEITDGNPAYKVNINWGDGRQGIYDSNQSEIFASHTYTSEATNTLKITVTDLANKVINYTAEITVSNAAVTKTAWLVDARHIGTNEYASNIPVSVSAAEVDGNTLQTFTTNWKPKAGSDNNYFVKYRLPIPSGVIKLTNNVRMTVIMSASNVPSYDRELALVTDKGELAASWIAEVEPPIPGYIRIKDFNGDDTKYISGLLNDDPQLKPIQSYAIEWRATAGEFSAQRYANSSYSQLEKLVRSDYVLQNSLNELNITFKGNGKIYLVKFEYDKNGNGQYDDGFIIANTENQNIDWSIYGGTENGSVIEPEMVPIPGTTYSMSKYETTFDQYDAYVEETGSRKPSDYGFGRGNRPVITIGWSDAVAYAAWLSQKTGKKYRLPTEKEWEFSARAGTTTNYSWGDDIGVNNANCYACGSQWDNVETAPVGSFQPNGFGLFDMHGNVEEWTSSCWDVNDCTYHVLRGGDWGDIPFALYSTYRGQIYVGLGNSSTGFRLVQDNSEPMAVEVPDMVVIPAGSFQMGTDRSHESDFPQIEWPAHNVSVQQFAMSKHEITFAQYDAFANATGRELPNDSEWGRGNRPVINVSWEDATAYAAWLSGKTGNSYRLPSEAEWEYAARAGSTTLFHWGNSVDCTKEQIDPCGRMGTAVVGSFEPNSFGLFDIHGNVNEWTQDCWNNSYVGAPSDGSVWTTGDCLSRVIRGGSWAISAYYWGRSASRASIVSSERSIATGFRLAQDLSTQASSSTSSSSRSSESSANQSLSSGNSSSLMGSSSSVSSELQSSSSSTNSSNNQSSSSMALLEPEMVVIPAGSFQMGNLGEGGTVFELPVHTVTVKSFAMSKYEITFVQYDAFAVATGRELPNDGGWGRGNRPVINVSWDDATAYVAWLSHQTGKSYRLVAEAEWEYAGRAGSETVFSWGNDIDCTKAHFIGDQSECGTNSTAIVGSYAPNSFGLHDMHGNVYEWTQDCFNNSYNGAPVDGSAWMVGDCGQHSVRGGSWSNNSFLLRSAYRGGWPSTERNIAVGFRVAQDLNNQTPSNPINGAWVSTATCNWESPLCDSWLIFLTGDKYFSIQTTQPDEGCTVGIELGSYTLNTTTGTFRPSPQIDTNDHCGVSDASESASVIVDGNQLSYKEAAGLGSVAFMKSPGATDYQGTWVFSENNRTEVLVITGSDYVLGIYDAGLEDVEQGSYSYNSTTGAFVITQFKQDKNTAIGFSGASNIKLQVSGSTLTISTDINPSNPQVFSRLQ